jgi:hypothetical protein
MSGFAVPSPHRIDRLRYLSTTILIDAAGIDPDPVNQLQCALLLPTMSADEGAEALDLPISLALLISSLEHIFVGGFIRAPTMGGYNVGWNVIIVELFELQRVDIEEAHGIADWLEASTSPNEKVRNGTRNYSQVCYTG